MCLLCRRKFANQEQLLKHEQQSEMHKQKVEEAETARKKQEIAQIKHKVMAEQAAEDKKMQRMLKNQYFAGQVCSRVMYAYCFACDACVM